MILCRRLRKPHCSLPNILKPTLFVTKTPHCQRQNQSIPLSSKLLFRCSIYLNPKVSFWHSVVRSQALASCYNKLALFLCLNSQCVLLKFTTRIPFRTLKWSYCTIKSLTKMKAYLKWKPYIFLASPLKFSPDIDLTYGHIYMNKYIYIYINIHTYIYIYIYTYIHIYIHTYIYIYIYTHIYTYIHILGIYIYGRYLQ